METLFDKKAKELYENANKIIDTSVIPQDFKNEFFSLVDKVNLSLMEEKDNFYGYFLFQMLREIRFDISSPTAINFKKAKYVIYFNPLIFLKLNIKQMETTIKHEILHILSMHLVRSKELKGEYSTLAINMAMDIVVNKYLITKIFIFKNSSILLLSKLFIKLIAASLLLIAINSTLCVGKFIYLNAS